jgi:uncharacterized protein YhaN
MKVSAISEFAGFLAAIVFAVLFFSQLQYTDKEIARIKKEQTIRLNKQKERYEDSLQQMRSRTDSLIKRSQNLQTEFQAIQKQRNHVREKRDTVELTPDTASVKSLYGYLTDRYGDSGIYIKTKVEHDHQ